MSIIKQRDTQRIIYEKVINQLTKKFHSGLSHFISQASIAKVILAPYSAIITILFLVFITFIYFNTIFFHTAYRHTNSKPGFQSIEQRTMVASVTHNRCGHKQ